jgi:hypothetical protein
VIDVSLPDALARLDQRLAVLLPPQYRERSQDMAPVPMRSAPFVYDASGQVAWDRMWQGFCDLAMAGGPPHKGRWLAPGTAADVTAAPERFDEVVTEIRRGVALATGLDARPSDGAGWVPVACYGEAMAEWMTRAIVMENVAARRGRVRLTAGRARFPRREGNPQRDHRGVEDRPLLGGPHAVQPAGSHSRPVSRDVARRGGGAAGRRRHFTRARRYRGGGSGLCGAW